MDFAEVIRGLTAQKRYQRKEWGENNVFIFLVPGSVFKVNREPLLSILGEGTDVKYRPHIDQRKADGTIGVWFPRSEDLLADDWQEV